MRNPFSSDLSRRLRLRLDEALGHLHGRRLRLLVAITAATPPLVAIAVGAYFWSTAGRLATYRPAEPSRLYAAPLVLRSGDPADRAALLADLESLGYRRVPRATRPGELALRADGLSVALRARRENGDAGEAGVAAAGLLEVEVAHGRVRALRVDGRSVDHDAGVSLGRPLLYTYYDAGLRECLPVRLAELPPHVVEAVLAAEDARFFRHAGVAPAGILRAAWEDLRAGEVRQGGSTITQQLVKNLWVGNRRTLGRKLREAVLAMLVEARFGKDDVLAAYLNEIYWGHAGGANLHGIGAAARAYFGKHPAELTLGEAATLAGMIQSPATYSPLTAPDRARQRRDWVLHRMAARRMVPRALAEATRAEPLLPQPLPVAGRRAPWFAVAMANEARERFDVERLGGTGHRLLSTLSSTEQAIAEQEVRRGLAHLERSLERRRRDGSPLEGALVSLAPESGRIRAWVGGRDFARSEFDRVAQARRQAGSAFKPIVFATALADGRLLPWELLRDSPVAVRMGGRDAWRPRNYDGSFHGEVTAAEAMAHSLNVPAVRVAVRAGLPRIVEVAQAMGITSPLEAVPALSLGACAVTPLELVTAYATLAGDGRRPTPRGLDAVVASDGEALTGEAPPNAERVLAAEAAYAVTAMLRQVLDGGTGRSTRAFGVRGALAGKTGTTDDRRDSWFAGYSADRATVVWVGYDDNQATRLSGSSGALPLWSRFVARAEPGGGWVPLTVPPGFVAVEVDPHTGLLATPYCPRRTRVELPDWRAPLRSCDAHLPQLAWWQAPSDAAASFGASQSLTEYIARSSPSGHGGRLHSDVTRVSGEGDDIRVGRGPGGETPVELPQPPGEGLPPASPPVEAPVVDVSPSGSALNGHR
jgi:penicillin-binding protein 1B